MNNGGVALEGGWRVYSSGAGIGVRLIMQCFLGLRVERNSLVIDPVIPAALDGLRVDLILAEQPISIIYQIQSLGHGPVDISINGVNLNFTREANAYRKGGVSLSLSDLKKNLTGTHDVLTISLS